MFFIKTLEQTITLHPSFFGPRIHEYLKEQLYRDMEGVNTGDFYIIAIMEAKTDLVDGQVMPGSGFAEYNIPYKALIWKPFKGEVLDGIVSKVVPNGFFVDIGPLTAFVSVASMPPRMKYDGNAAPPAFVEHQEIGPISIAERTLVRVRIRGIRAEKGQMYAIATINDDYLGVLPDEEEG